MATSVRTPDEPGSPTATRRPSRPRSTPRSRRVGYAIAVVVNLVLLLLTLVWPGWEAVPFLTGAAAEIVPLFAISLVAAMAANLVNLIADSRALRAIGDIVTAAISFFVGVRTWQVFPFDFGTSTFDWEPIVRVLLVLAMFGVVISILVNFVILVRIAVGRPPD